MHEVAADRVKRDDESARAINVSINNVDCNHCSILQSNTSSEAFFHPGSWEPFQQFGRTPSSALHLLLYNRYKLCTIKQFSRLDV